MRRSWSAVQQQLDLLKCFGRDHLLEIDEPGVVWVNERVWVERPERFGGGARLDVLRHWT